MAKVQVDLKPMPDAHGFLYGEAVVGDTSYRVNIMPPIAEWRGDAKLEGHVPHDTDWIIYIDGEEMARVQCYQDLAPFVRKLLG